VEQQLAAMTLDVAGEFVHYVPPLQRCRCIILLMDQHRFLLVIPELGQKLIAQ
jgi:hypothetical protein